MPVKSKLRDRMSIFAPRGGGKEDANEFVSVNAHNFLIPKGKTSSVPYAIGREFMRAQKAKAKMFDRIDALIAASNNPDAAN